MAQFELQPTLNSFLKEYSSTTKKGWTNNVFKFQKDNKVIYLLPAYLRLKVKNIMGIDLFTLTGQVNCALILSIFYSEMQEQAVEYLQKSIEIAFHKSEALRLDQDNLQVNRKNDTKKKLLTFTLRKAITTKLEGDIFWSPFETVKFQISMTLRSLRTSINGADYTFKFNLMNCDNMETKFSLSQETMFGIFKIAQNQLSVEYSNNYSLTGIQKSNNKKVAMQKGITLTSKTIQMSKRLSKQKLIQEEQLEPLSMTKNLNNFQYAHFVLPLYKKPNPAIITIYIPLLFLGIINLGIFYQNNKQTGKIMLNISALLVSFIALIPTVRENTAVSPTVTFTQILVFIESFTTVLTLIHMIQYRDQNDFTTDMQTDGLLIASVVITCLVAACIFVLILLHKFIWKRKYHKKVKQNGQIKFKHDQWKNEECDRYYEMQVFGIQQHIVPLKQKNKRTLMKVQNKQE